MIVYISVEDGKKLEKEVNETGPGEGYFIKCDVSKEGDIKVNLLSNSHKSVINEPTTCTDILAHPH